MKTIINYYDHIKEIEIDNEWRRQLSKEYLEYRKQFELAKQGKVLPKYPLSIEMEASHFCNLKCPKCPRVLTDSIRDDKHMKLDLYERIIEESKEKGLKALLMDHEAESLMNPNFIAMVEMASMAGIIDIWLHTNANLLTPDISERLIDAGLTKINFSLDAATEETYDKVRVGGDFKRAISNINEFLRIKVAKKAHYLRTRVSFVVMDVNVHEKDTFFEYWLRQKGLNIVTFQACVNWDIYGKEDPDNGMIERELELKYVGATPFFCSQLWEQPIIDVDGNVVPCGNPIVSKYRDFILGNIDSGKDTIESCWHCEKMSRLRKIHKEHRWYVVPMCRLCQKVVRKM